MEDFIKILIWAIIIVSFLSSVFKKKKNKEKQPQTPQRVPDNEANIPKRVEPQLRASQSKEEIDSYNDMLSEIENLFKKDNELKAKTSDKTKIETHEVQKKSVQYDPQWHKETQSEHTVNTDWVKDEKALERKAAVDFNIENKAKKFEEMTNKKSDPIGIFKHTIKEKLNHPETLKDYILISEIIGKPKAKRR
jgi:hypothetical protein